MKKGKLILGFAATIVTVAGAFAFKASKFSGHNKLFGTTGGSAHTCLQVNCWTAAGEVSNQGACTTGGSSHTALANKFDTKTSGGHCKTAVTHYTRTLN
jgi:hypothetical protein